MRYFSDQIPAECRLGVTPPDIWIIDKCATITMDCTDPTLAGTSHLTYDVSGNYSTGFNLNSSDSGVFEICYTKTISGFYEVCVCTSSLDPLL